MSEAPAGPGRESLTDSSTDGVDVAGIAKSFDGATRVLHGVDVSVDAGATLALLGPSGCGKTTLLRIIAGLEVPDEGTVTVGGRELTGSRGVVPPERRRIGMVFQDWALFPHLSVARNVGFGLPRSERRSSPRIDEALELVGLAGLGDRMPSTLSGGQQQRVALARAIAPRPSVLLLDEPFSNLDATLRSKIRTEIHQLLVELGITTIFVTHDQDEAFVLGDRVAVLRGGRIVQVGSPEELYLRPATRWLADFVGDANFIPALADGDVAQTAIGDLPLDRPAEGRIEVLVRPEHLDMHPPVPSADRGRAADEESVVELVEYVGHDTTYLVRQGDLMLKIRRPSLPVAQRGESVRLRYVGGATAWFEAAT
jgi:iron(III) transport system ATP-binding protein